jgi:PIN domain nuclease of toxin-antitoxin system
MAGGVARECFAPVSDGIVEITVSSALARRAVALPELHNDPADRILITTALENDLTLLAPDQQIQAYPAPVLWQPATPAAHPDPPRPHGRV